MKGNNGTEQRNQRIAKLAALMGGDPEVQPLAAMLVNVCDSPEPERSRIISLLVAGVDTFNRHRQDDE